MTTAVPAPLRLRPRVVVWRLTTRRDRGRRTAEGRPQTTGEMGRMGPMGPLSRWDVWDTSCWSHRSLRPSVPFVPFDSALCRPVGLVPVITTAACRRTYLGAGERNERPSEGERRRDRSIATARNGALRRGRHRLRLPRQPVASRRLRRSGLDPVEIRRSLDELPRDDRHKNWLEQPIRDLIDYLRAKRHTALSMAMTHAVQVLHSPCEKCGRHPQELAAIRDAFAGLVSVMRPHVSREERVLFPISSISMTAGRGARRRR